MLAYLALQERLDALLCHTTVDNRWQFYFTPCFRDPLTQICRGAQPPASSVQGGCSPPRPPTSYASARYWRFLLQTSFGFIERAPCPVHIMAFRLSLCKITTANIKMAPSGPALSIVQLVTRSLQILNTIFGYSTDLIARQLMEPCITATLNDVRRRLEAWHYRPQ